MIKMTDNQSKNVFKFFCDICGKEINKTAVGECLFIDTEKNHAVVPVFTHQQKCSQIYEKSVGDACGNMNLEEFIEILGESI